MQLPRFFSGVFSDSVFIIRIHPLNFCCIFYAGEFCCISELEIDEWLYVAALYLYHDEYNDDNH